MAPRKNADLPQKKPVKLKNPTNVRKIVNSGPKPPKIQRRVTFQRKIELANEVALAQFQTKSLNSLPERKTSPAKLSPSGPELVNSKIAKTPLPKRKRKSTAKVTSAEESGSDDYLLAKKATNPPEVTVPVKKRQRKPAATTFQNETVTQPVFKTPSKRNLVHTTDDESKLGSQEPKKKRLGPKKKTTPQTKIKFDVKPLPDTPECNESGVKIVLEPVSVRKAKNGLTRKLQQERSDSFTNEAANVEATVVPQEIVASPARRVCVKKKQTAMKPETKKKSPKTVARKTRGRTKFFNKRYDKQNNTASTRSKAKGKGLNAKEIEVAVLELENAIKIEPAKITTRLNSMNSTNSNLSWTKDISTASSVTSETTTCVTVSSNDFVRFDNKLPFVQVENTNFERLKSAEENKKRLVQESSSSSSDSDSDSSSDSELDVTDSKPELNLSTSSLTPNSPQSESKPDNTELLCLEMDKLTNSLKNFHSEMRKWIELDDDSFSISPVLETMSLEKDLITNCENFKGIMDAIKCPTEKPSPIKSVRNSKNISPQANSCRNYQDRSEAGSPEKTGRKDFITEFVKPMEKSSPDKPGPIKSGRKDSTKIGQQATRCRNYQDSSEAGSSAKTGQPDWQWSIRRMSIAKTRNSHANSSVYVPAVSDELSVTITPPNPNGSIEQSPESFTNDNYKYLSFDKTYDDEDALSIFAESITGVESSRRGSVASISNVSQDTYVPKPTTGSWMPEKYVYKPTRIDEFPTKIEDEHALTDKLPPKTNDTEISFRSCVSSSVSKDTDRKMDLVEDGDRLSSPADLTIKRATETQQASQQRLFALYKPVQNVKSSLYRGHCFFYIAFQCKNIHCRFPHADIDRNLLKCRLALLNEDNLIEEYLLTRNFVALRRKFGLLFIEECKRRKATRILMEMAIDLGLGVIEWEDENLIVNALETTLLHLNSISFDACDDQLKFEHNNIMMCDALLLCMANSQNFAQFKRAFAKLAFFMWDIKRPVNVEVVGCILERVCILPGEDLLAKGMLCLMKNTDVSIFDNNLTKSFEVQLYNIESDVHEAYLMAYREALKALLAEPTTEVADPSPATPALSPVDRDVARHTSPDSTNTDRMHTAENTEHTTFQCTINNEINNLFKSPTNPASKPRYAMPRVWRRGMGYPLRTTVRPAVPSVARRGRFLATRVPSCMPYRMPSRMPTGRRVNRAQLVCKVGDTKLPKWS